MSPKVTLNTMVLVWTMLMSRYFIKSDYMFIKYNDPNMVCTNTMGFRVTMGDNMCLCSPGLGFSPSLSGNPGLCIYGHTIVA